MRFAERLLRIGCLIAASATLAACAMFDDKSASAPSSATAPGATADAKGVTAAAASAKGPAGPTIPRPESPPINPTVQRTFDAARQALAAGHTAEAERSFVALTKSNPELAGPYANLGLIHRQAGKTADAVAAFEQAVQLSPQQAELHNQLGVTYRMAGDFAKAKASYERSIALDANYAAAVLNLGILYDLYLWDGARALELYDRYLQLTPGGDEQVKRWVSDLRNRSAQKSAPQRKEQG
jgi:tetratricopeptide (TPR) repeat protein